MALATTNFEVGLVQLAIQNGSVYSAQRPVAPTYAMLLGKDAEMQDNIISGVKGVPTYGALSDAEIRSGILRSFVGYQTTLGGSVTRANQTAALSAPFTPQEVLTDLAFRTCYYSDGGQFVNLARMVEGQGAGWAANVSYEQVLASQLVQEYIKKRSDALFVNAATGLPADGQFGSLRAMITDGLTVADRGGIGTNESALAVYAGQTRSTTNTIVSAQYYWAPVTGTVANADLTEAHAATAALRGYANGAGKLVAPMSLGRYAKFERDLRQDYGQIRIDEDVKLLVNGGRCVEFEGVTWYPEPSMPSNATWQLLIDLGTPGMPNAIARTAMQKSQIELIKAPNLNAADRLRWVFPDQSIVRNPKSCVLIEGLNAL